MNLQGSASFLQLRIGPRQQCWVQGRFRHLATTAWPWLPRLTQAIAARQPYPALHRLSVNPKQPRRRRDSATLLHISHRPLA